MSYLCMHPEPEFFDTSEGMVVANRRAGVSRGASLYGVTYRNSKNPFDKNADEVAACAVCEHEEAASVYVQWGRRTCSNGHQTVYSGLLMANLYNYFKAEHICVDWERAKTATSTAKFRAGGYLHTTEWGNGVYLGYTGGHELTCAVCSPAPKSVVYTRWGSTECPSGATELYKSFIANSRRGDNGNGVNWLCMHPEPQDPEATMDKRFNAGGALLHPVQYMNIGAVFANMVTKGGGPQRQWTDSACIVCERPQTASVYVQWGRRTCSNDHTLEYAGMVRASYYTQKKTEYICVDDEQAVNAHSGSNVAKDDGNGMRLYSTEMQAGASGDEYGADKEVSCAVCASPAPVYTRWGATTCPGGSTTLYEGFMATSHRTYTGSGYNYVCMHPEPEWHQYMNPGNQDGALLWGVEYTNSGSMDKNHLHDAACAVCQLKSGNVLPYVQWGRKTCASDHKLVYTGLVMANSHFNKGATEFVCVDIERAAHKTSKVATELGSYLFSTEFENAAQWGLDQYGGATEHKEVACAVCA